jgi:hypothetical protein
MTDLIDEDQAILKQYFQMKQLDLELLNIKEEYIKDKLFLS